MAKTASLMLPLGTIAPPFLLPDPQGRSWSLAESAGPLGLLVMFICNHCPYVKHVGHELGKLGRDYQGRIGLVAINSNDTDAYPDDRPELMIEASHLYGFKFPYLFDESQAVATAYQAACTPDFFLFDRFLKLRYRGQLDSSRPGNGIPVTGEDLRSALDSVALDQELKGEQKPSIGCNIKWRRN